VRRNQMALQQQQLLLLRWAATAAVVASGAPPIPCSEVQAQLTAAVTSHAPQFVLPASVGLCSVDFEVLGAEDFVLSGDPGGNTTLWFEPSRAGFRVMNSRNVTVRLIAIDHDPLPYIQAEITAIRPGAAPSYSFSMGVRSLPFEFLNGSMGPMSQPWLWNGAGAERWVKGRAPMPPLSKLTKEADGTWSTTAGFPEISGAQVGDALTVMLRQWHTYVIGNSSSVLSEDITIYSAKSLNFYELDGGGGHVYRRVKNLRRDRQLISSNADCFHSIDVAVGPTIMDSELGYCLDDFFNIHNTYVTSPVPVPWAEI
jgi:hypothetical protein